MTFIATKISFAIKRQITTPTGYAKISTKEQTLVDLIRFHAICGYLSNVSHIIRDLSEDCNHEFFAQVVALEKIETVLQRLATLELVGFPNLAITVEHELAKRRVYDTS